MLLSVYTNLIQWLEQHQLPCLFKTAFHFDCPGCGLQRSTIALLKGDVVGSLELYPALIPILILFGVLILHLLKKINNGIVLLKYMYVICASIILISYLYKIINH